MSISPAGSFKKTLFSQVNHLAPLPLPTGRGPRDCLGIIWRKNDTFMDISNFNIASAVQVGWFHIIFCLILAFILKDPVPLAAWGLLWLGTAFSCIISLFLFIALKRPTPPPVRFNRQRREVYFQYRKGEYWVIPWENVIATSSQLSNKSKGGNITYGILAISLEKPDDSTLEKNCALTMTFSCGDGENAIALWECVRTYMEVGAAAITDDSARFSRSKGIWASYLDDLRGAAKRKGWLLTLLWDGFFALVMLNILLGDLLERKKLYPLPDLDHPDIIEWSKPLPPEQWAKPSAEFQAALAELQARQQAA